MSILTGLKKTDLIFYLCVFLVQIIGYNKV